MTSEIMNEALRQPAPTASSRSVVHGPRAHGPGRSPKPPLAATSWLWPGSLAANLARMAAWDLPIRQAALLFYQHAPSLEYTRADFLPGAGLDCHVHLPIDLPWQGGAKACFDIILRLMSPPGPLVPWGGVLHPPASPHDLDGVAALWREAAPGWRLMIENVPGQDLREHWPVIREYDLPVCLDVGHLMAFGQHWLLGEPELPGRVELLHCYAPGPFIGRHEHLALTLLTPGQKDMLREIFALVSSNIPVLFEVFSQSDLLESLGAFNALRQEWRMDE